MQRDRIMAACKDMPAAVEEYPFGEGAAVFKVYGKMFALVSTAGYVNLKCDPELAVSLRGQFVAVTPGYHMNKRHWNSIALDDSLPDDLVEEWLAHSYDLVVAGLPRATRERLHWRTLSR